jgi:hypothetical protein
VDPVPDPLLFGAFLNRRQLEQLTPVVATVALAVPVLLISRTLVAQHATNMMHLAMGNRFAFWTVNFLLDDSTSPGPL